MPIKISCKDKAGFRRCGVLFPKGETVYPDDEFTPEQIDILKAEKHLSVEIVQDESKPGWGTIAEIKQTLKDMNIEYPKDAKRADLIGLIEANSGPEE